MMSRSYGRYLPQLKGPTVSYLAPGRTVKRVLCRTMNGQSLEFSVVICKASLECGVVGHLPAGSAEARSVRIGMAI